MGRQFRSKPVRLGASGVESLSDVDLRAILRGADDIVARGGRTLLMRVLRGSRSRDVLERELDKSPVYSYFKALSDKETLARIDWTILNGYLRIEHIDRLPLLTYTEKGWRIERETFADELLARIELQLANGPPYDMDYLKERERGMIFLLLDKIEAKADSRFTPVLRAWEEIDFKKVQRRIGQVIRRLEGSPEN